MNTARGYVAGAGTQTAGIAFGGMTNPPAVDSANTEIYNGATWTEVNNLQTARNGLGRAGTSTAALAIAGFVRSPTNAQVKLVELWNGTNWTETTDINGVGKNMFGSGGTSTSALMFGGNSQTIVSALTRS